MYLYIIYVYTVRHIHAAICAGDITILDKLLYRYTELTGEEGFEDLVTRGMRYSQMRTMYSYWNPKLVQITIDLHNHLSRDQFTPCISSILPFMYHGPHYRNGAMRKIICLSGLMEFGAIYTSTSELINVQFAIEQFSPDSWESVKVI
jgi:hypothetical protein